MKDGWISLHRKIKEHWIWDDPVKFQWWIDLLMTVNHTSKTVNIGFELFECSRGQTVLSLSTLASRWMVSRDTVRNFLVLLEKDNMITRENLVKSTRITICNYDDYQSDLHNEQTQSKRKANAKQTQSDTNNNDNKENNENNENNIGESEIEKNKKLEFERFNKWVDENAPYVRKIKNQITLDEYFRLTDIYSGDQIKEILFSISNYKDAPKKYTSVNLTFRKWAKKEYGTN